MNIDPTEKTKLRKIKKVSRKLEMTLDAELTGLRALQFVRDTEMYGLYEALLYLEHAIDVSDTTFVDILHAAKKEIK